MSLRLAWPQIPPSFTAALLSGHSAVGLAFGALIYLVCLTGTISVLVDELKLVEQPAPAAAPLRPDTLNHAIGAVLAEGPATTVYAIAPVTPRQRLTISAYGSAGEKSFIVGSDGRLTRQHTPFTDFVTDLHMTLTMPAPWGSLMVGLIGAALLSLILSGVLSHPRIFRDAFRLRLNGSERLREAELHNRLSVWGLPFHVVVTTTGALFGLANLAVMAVAALGFHGDVGQVYAPISGPTVAPNPRPAPMPDISALVARSLAERPGGKLYYVGLERPATRGARVAIEVTAPGRLPRGEDFYYDATGREVGRGRFTTGSLGLQAYSAAAQLHFGFFGGLPVRLIYVTLGAALTFISASGVTIWLARQADKGRPRPRLRRAWLAWTFGVQAALLISAAASPILSVPLVFWSVALGAQALAQGAALYRRVAEKSPPLT